MPGMPTIIELVAVPVGVAIGVGVGVGSTTTRGVYHLRGLLPRPSSIQQASTSAMISLAMKEEEPREHYQE